MDLNVATVVAEFSADWTVKAVQQQSPLATKASLQWDAVTAKEKELLASEQAVQMREAALHEAKAKLKQEKKKLIAGEQLTCAGIAL